MMTIKTTENTLHLCSLKVVPCAGMSSHGFHSVAPMLEFCRVVITGIQPVLECHRVVFTGFHFVLECHGVVFTGLHPVLECRRAYSARCAGDRAFAFECRCLLCRFCHFLHFLHCIIPSFPSLRRSQGYTLC